MVEMRTDKKFRLAGINWKVLAEEDGNFLCLGDSIGYRRFGSNDDWRESRIRKELNTDFLQKIEAEIGEGVLQEFERDLLSLNGQTEYGICKDKVSILTFDEYRKYRKVISNTGYWWWLSTPDSTQYNNDLVWVVAVSPAGIIDSNSYGSSCCVRPFCIFPSSIFESKE